MMLSGRGDIADWLSLTPLFEAPATADFAAIGGVKEGLTAIGIMGEDRSSEGGWKIDKRHISFVALCHLNPLSKSVLSTQTASAT